MAASVTPDSCEPGANGVPQRPRILITDGLHPDVLDALQRRAEVWQIPVEFSPAEAADALRREVATAQGLIVRRPLPPDLFDCPNDLRGVVRHGAGLDFIPVESATRRGIPVANTPGVNAVSVAEYVIAGMLAASRRLAAFDREVRAGNWQVRRLAGARTFELRGRTLGIVGFGNIGKEIARIAAQGFGMTVRAHTATPSRLPADIEALSLEELFSACDFVALACPLTDATRGMIHAGVLAHARPGCVLINVARGPVVREADLAAALSSGVLAGAVLDVFEQQPLPADSPLAGCPGVVLTPHLAGMTGDAERAMGTMAIETQFALIRGERPSNVVNLDGLAKKEKETP